MTIDEVTNAMGVTFDELKAIKAPLVKAGEIKTQNFGYGLTIFAWNESRTAYDDKKYIELGRKKFNDDIYDVVKWFLPITLAIITIFTTCTTIRLNKDKQMLQQRIDKIESLLTPVKK